MNDFSLEKMTGNDGFVLQLLFKVAFFVSHSIYMKMDLLYVLIIDILLKHYGFKFCFSLF